MRSHLFHCVVLPVGLLALFAQGALAQADALNFFNNWFVTGDYAVAGTGLANAGGMGTIIMSTVPCTTGVGPSAASAPCNTAGAVPAYPVAAFLYWQTVESTPAAAGAAGFFNGAQISGELVGSDASSACWLNTGSAPSQRLRVYRADVLRFLPLDPTAQIRRANGTHTVALGNGVSGNAGVLVTEGASLVVIYRVVVPGRPTLVQLRSVVIYDGAFTLSSQHPLMTQNILGFYQASNNPAATMTHIVGNGRAAFYETLKASGNIPAGVSATQPFVGAQGPNWDNLTFGIKLLPNASSAETNVLYAGNAGSCLSWGAVVTSTNVQDSDNDGLLDVWKRDGLHRNTQVSPATFGGCQDYPTEPCVNLPGMGAVNGVQDIFLQIDWMHGYGDNTGGIDGTGFHLHIPKLGALTAVAKAFASQNIALHFDVGDNYQGMGLPFIIPYRTGPSAAGRVLAEGGSDIDEATLRCNDTLTHTCDYHEPYPVLSFKLGLASVRDGNHLLNIPAHFAQDRKDIFHYVLFAHALAGPFDLTGKPLTTDPESISGVGDRPGGDLMVTLGLWRSDVPANDQVGSVLVQSGTLMHELGHNLDLSHAGWKSAPNCMPDYASVMSYLYQTRGLTDANGVEQIDYSYGRLAGLNENSLSATAPLGPLQYRVRFFGPLNPLVNSPGQAAQVHCDGTPITNGALEVRLEGSTLSTPDWSNGTVKPLGSTFPLDVNFDGILGETLTDQPDWASLNFAQIGGRTNFGSLSTGSLATDAGSLATDAGSLATDAGSLATDAGSLATDAGSLATDAGSLATDAGSLATDAGDEDYVSHILSSTDGIPTPQQCTGCGLTAANGLSAITLGWTPPNTGGRLTYNLYRCAGAGCTPSLPAFKTGLVPSSASAPAYTDSVNDFVHAGATCPTAATCYNTTYTYSVTAVSPVGTESLFSNTASSEVTHLFVIAGNQTVVYGSPNPPPAFTIYGDVASSLSAAAVSCTYAPVGPRNVGAYAIACAGPAATSAADGVTYNAAYLSYLPGVLTISPRPITVTAAATSKTYDGTTVSAAAPSITSGSLAYADTAKWTESYDSKDVGTGHVMTPSGAVSDGNGGNNYAVTLVTVNTGVILKAPLTIMAATNTKTYDGNSRAAAVPTVVGIQTGDSVTGLAETYDSASAGTGKTLSVSAFTVNDGNSGGDYTVTTVANTTGVIRKAYAAITVTPYSVTYDGIAHTATGTATGVLGESLSGLVLTGATHTNAGTYGADIWTFTDSTGNYNNASGAIHDSIAKANLKGSVTVSNKVYDGTTAATVVTRSLTGVIGGDVVSLVGGIATFANKNAGNADEVIVTGLSLAGAAAGNYMVSSEEVTTANIAPAPLAITADNKSVAESSPNPPFTVTYLTLLGGDTPGSLAGNLVCTTTRIPASPVGSYPITCSGQSSTNYTVTYISGTLTVF